MRRRMFKVSYRHTLSRDTGAEGVKEACWVMLNPSTADDELDDQTIRSVMRISAANGFRFVTVCNVFGIRATDPADLKDMHSAGIDVWGGSTMTGYRKALLTYADAAVVGWGAHDLRWSGFEPADTLKQVREMQSINKRLQILCCGKNADGSPKHPCRLPGDTKLVPFG